MKYTREDDLVVALQAATEAMKQCGRFDEVARVNGDDEAARRVTEVADVYVAWLRRIKTVRLTLVAIEEMDTGEIASTPEGASAVTNIDSSQRARYVINATDDRDFPVDASLAARASDEGVVTLVIEEGPDTASGKDELVATFAGLGTTTVEVFDPTNPDVVLAADVVVANPGGVAAATLSAPVIEEISATGEPEVPEVPTV